MGGLAAGLGAWFDPGFLDPDGSLNDKRGGYPQLALWTAPQKLDRLSGFYVLVVDVASR